MILVALGSNIASSAGKPAETIKAALAVFGEHGIKIEAQSHLYRSPAWPDRNDPPFVNAVARVTTDLAPDALLATLHGIENAFGRTRAAKNAPRTLDLDLIDYDGAITRGLLELPHPRMQTRDFVLFPLRDAAPSWRHPVSGASVDALIAALPDGDIEKLPD